MRILILEDDEERVKLFKRNLIPHTLTITDDVDKCIAELSSKNSDNVYDVIFLDHDLGGHVFVQSGGDEPTGYDVACWIAKNYKDEDLTMPKLAVVHSLNPQGRTNIINQLRITDIFIADQPFIWKDEDLSSGLEKVMASILG